MAATQEVPESVGIRDLLEAGLHFGHQTKRWNPKMKRYIFDKRNGIHIIDLAKSLVMLEEASQFLQDVVSRGQSVLFVGTKKQAQQVIKETAEACNQHYVTHRWLGGTLTNNKTIKKSVARYRELEGLQKNGSFDTMHKKEAACLRRELVKLERNLSGVANMSRLPGAMFVVDVNREAIAVSEANNLGIPVVAMVDTNCNPDPIDYVIPGNDDAIRAIRLIASMLASKVKNAAEEYARIAAEKAQREAEERKAAEAEAKAKREAQQKARAEAAEAKKAAEAHPPAEATTEDADEHPAPKKAAAKPKTTKRPAAAAPSRKVDAIAKPAAAETENSDGPQTTEEAAPEPVSEAAADVEPAPSTSTSAPPDDTGEVAPAPAQPEPEAAAEEPKTEA